MEASTTAPVGSLYRTLLLDNWQDARKNVRVKKRKAGIAINAAVVKEVMAKYQKTVAVVYWSIPGKDGFAVPSEQTTAEFLSSQEAEVQLAPDPDLQTQVEELDVFKRQVVSDVQERIQHTATLVVGRLVRTASTRQDEESDKNALTNYVSAPLRKCKIRDWLHTTGSQHSPEEFAEKFDGMYSDRCGEQSFFAIVVFVSY